MINLKLFIHLLKHMLLRHIITFSRIRNFLQVVLSSILKSCTVSGMPPSIALEPTAFCNLKCPLCPTGNDSLCRPQGEMSFDVFKKIMDDIGDKIIHLTLWGYGEPFMHRDIYRMISYAKRKNIFVRTSTNGHFFSDRKEIEKLLASDLDNLIVALDGASQESLNKYRTGADFNTIIESLRLIMKLKKKRNLSYPYVELQFIVMRHNEHELSIIRKIASDIGVDKLTIKTPQYNTPDEMLPEKEAWQRNVRKENRCHRLWLSSTITWDGAVVPCCYDHHNDYVFGVLDYDMNMKFMDIWNNRKYQKFRKHSLALKKKLNMCKYCHGSFVSLNKD